MTRHLRTASARFAKGSLAAIWFSTLVSCATPQRDASSARAALDDRAVLPLVRVRLYESGVGYFERRGQLERGKSALPVPAGHLDDALKSLVLLSPDLGLQSVSFASRLSPAVARARAGLPANQETPLSYDRLLVALRGEQVELTLIDSVDPTTPRKVSGRVIDAVSVSPAHPSYDHGMPNQVMSQKEQPAEEHERIQVLLLSDAGEILRVDASQLQAIKALDDVVASRLHAAMSAHLATRSNQRQVLDLIGAGSRDPNAEIALAYLAEAPTWRASYRLVMSDSGPPNSTSRLQAWALIHNDTDETWDHVKVELIHGRPTSFLFPITAPRYERRELETPEIELSSVPQLSTTTPDALWGDFSDYDGESMGRVGDYGIGGMGSGEGFGSGGGGLGGSHRTKAPRVKAAAFKGGSDLLWVGDLAQHVRGVAAARQTSSVYHVAGTLDLAPQHSAMVPFLSAELQAEPILWFSGFDAPAQRAVGISNTTSTTLPAGPLAVYGQGGFLGEAMLTTLQPGGRQFAQVSDEPDAKIDTGPVVQSSETKHVDFRNGQLRVHRIQTSTRRLTFSNQSGRVQKAYVALPVVLNAAVTGCDQLDFETTSATPFAVFDLPLATDKDRTLVAIEAVSDGTLVGDLTHDFLEQLVATATLPERERAVIQRGLPLLEAWHASRRKYEELEADIEALTTELRRLREDLKSLSSGESGAAHTRLVQRVFDREDAWTRANARKRALDQELSTRQTELEVVLAEFDQFRDPIIAQRRSDQTSQTQ